MNLYDAIFVKMTARNFRMGEFSEVFLRQILDFANYTTLLWNRSSLSYEIWSYEKKQKMINKQVSFKAPHYFVATVEDNPDELVNLGFIMEQIRLYLVTKDVSSFFVGFRKLEKAAGDGKGKLMAVLAFGTVMSDNVIGESSKMRRMDLKRLCVFKDNVGQEMMKLLNAARLTPSYGNNQPWRFVVMNHRIHVFCKKERFGSKSLERYDHFDIGCMLSHMMIAGEEMWFNLEVSKSDVIAEKDLRNNVYMFSVLLSAQG